MARSAKALEVARYVEATGRQPPAPHADPVARWQWEYRGTRREKETLRALLRRR